MQSRTIEQILASTSDILFPAECGKKAITISSRAADGDSALHVLVWQNDIEGTQLLIGAGADVNAVGDMGYTPLHVAIGQNNVAMAIMLINAGARSDLETGIGGTARDEALRRGGELAALFPLR